MRVKDLMTIIFLSSSHNHLVKRQCDLREKVSMIKICITTVEIGHWSMSILSMEHLQEDVRTMLNKSKRCEYLFIYYFTTGLFLTETRALPEISSRQKSWFWHPPPKKIQVYLKLKFNVCCLYKDGRAGAHLTFFNTIRAVG